MEDRADNLLATDAQAPGPGARRRAGVRRRRHVPQPAHQGRRRLRRLLHVRHRGQHQPVVADRRPVPRSAASTYGVTRGAHQQEPAGRAPRRGLGRHATGCWNGSSTPRPTSSAWTASSCAARNLIQPDAVPVQDPHRQHLRLRRLPGGAGQGARARRPRLLAGRAGARARRGALHRHRRGLRPAAQHLLRRPSSGSTTSARPPPFTTTAESVRMRIGPTGGSPRRCSRRSGATRRRRSSRSSSPRSWASTRPRSRSTYDPTVHGLPAAGPGGSRMTVMLSGAVAGASKKLQGQDLRDRRAPAGGRRDDLEFATAWCRCAARRRERCRSPTSA